MDSPTRECAVDISFIMGVIMLGVHVKITKPKRACLTLAAVVLGLIVLVLCIQEVRAIHHANKFESVLITGRHHMGPSFNVSDFYINGHAGGNVGREGGGGSLCCILLPKKWRPGLVAEVRWQVSDWSREKEPAKSPQVYKNLTWVNYKALVPVEPYETPEQMYVHFFENGRVRVVSSFAGSGHIDHPIASDDPSAASRATAGVPITELFSKSELDARAERASKRRMW